jgi:hypothetical protein
MRNTQLKVNVAPWIKTEEGKQTIGLHLQPLIPGFPGTITKRSSIMAEPTKPSDPLVWVKDKEGNEFICHLSQLKDPKKATKEELDQCVDSGSAAYDPGN